MLKAVFRTMSSGSTWGRRLPPGRDPHLIEREGTSNENVPETHVVLKEIRKLIDQSYPNKLRLAEANMWPKTCGLISATATNATLRSTSR